PVQVLEDEQRRTVARDRFDEDADGEEQRLAVGDGCLRGEADEDRQVTRNLFGGSRLQHRGDGVAQLRKRRIGRIALEDAAELLQLAGERAVCAAFAVGERSSAHREASELLDGARELSGNARLADSCFAYDRDEMWRAL